MTLFHLAENALFLTNWRERMRFAPTVSSITVAVIIIILLFMACYFRLGDEYNANWPREMFWFLILGQGVLLLVLGTISAEQMSVRERFSGTLDFHRSSPTPRFQQVWGLLLGAPCLEWCIFLMTLPVCIYVGWVGHLKMVDIALFYGSLILCSLFFHILAVLLGLIPDRKKATSLRRSGGLKIFILIYIVIGIASTTRSSALNWATWAVISALI